METPQYLSADLSAELFQLQRIVRMDIMAIDGADASLNNSSSSYDYCDLFWKVWRPEGLEVSIEDESVGHLTDQLPELPDTVQNRMLATLERLEQAKRLDYYSDWEDHYDINELIYYVHIAAARGIALRRRDGYSEDATDCFNKAWRFGRLLHDEPSISVEAPQQILSVFAINGLVLIELSMAEKAAAAYGEALRLLTLGLKYLDTARAVASDPDVDDALSWLRGPGEEEFAKALEDEKAFRFNLAENLNLYNLDPQDAMDIAEAIINQSRGVDWKQVAEDCRELADYWNWFVNEKDQPITDPKGNKTTWGAVWHYFQGRAEEKLSPNDRRDLLDLREDKDSETRLRQYFFEGDLWEQLPDRVRQSLVDAERTWFSGRAGRIESALNDLQVATESLCYCLIWERLLESEHDPKYAAFKQSKDELLAKGHQPTLATYEWLCRQHLVRDLAASLGLGEDDTRYLALDLPEALRELRVLRNLSEHDPNRKWRREEVTPIVNKFLGIGQQGVLPRLAEINKRKAAQERRTRGSKY